MGDQLRRYASDLAGMIENGRTLREGSWNSTYRLLAEEGHTWQGSTLPTGWRRGPAKACYQNSWNKARTSDHLVYCEGIGLDEDLPIPLAHAWLLDTRTGQVIDSTWKAGSGITYLGLAIPAHLVEEALIRSADAQVISVLEGDWARRGWFHQKNIAQQAIDYTHTITQAPLTEVKSIPTRTSSRPARHKRSAKQLKP